MTEEWGPWIDHDGKGCPCVGEYVQARVDSTDEIQEAWAYANGPSWDWSNSKYFARVLSYRIRKPKGMSVLEGILQDVEDEKVKEIVG